MGRIIFYGYNQLHAGGVQNLQVNLSKYFADHSVEVIVFAKKESYVFKNLDAYSSNITLINTSEILEDKWHTKVFSEDVILITSFNIDYSPLLKANPKVLFWSVFPGVFKKANDLKFTNLKWRTINLIEYLSRNKALLFMDGSNFDALRINYKVHFKSPNFLPIPVLVPEKEPIIESMDLKMPIRVTYLGRGDVIWKVKPIKKALSDIDEFGHRMQLPIVLTIITNTKSLFEAEFLKIRLQTVKVEYKLDLSGADLDDYLKKHSSLNIAMGTSALESAKMSVPTLLIDASNKDLPENYKYNWLFTSKSFDLGRVIDMYPAANPNGFAIDDIFSQLFKNSIEISQKCYQYASKNHSMANVAERLNDLIGESAANLRDFSKLTVRQHYLFQLTRKKVR